MKKNYKIILNMIKKYKSKLKNKNNWKKIIKS